MQVLTLLILLTLSGCSHMQYYVACMRDGSLYYERVIEQEQLELPDRNTFVIRETDGSGRVFRARDCIIMNTKLYGEN
jgi:hypothetical protein